MCEIWLALRIWLHRLFHPAPAMGHPVGGFEIHVVDNLGYLLRPYYWTSYLSLFAFTWLFVYARWRDVPEPGVRRMLWIGPVYLLAMYVVGVLSEIRIFGELIALYAIAFTLLLRALLQAHETQGTHNTQGAACARRSLRRVRRSAYACFGCWTGKGLRSTNWVWCQYG